MKIKVYQPDIRVTLYKTVGRTTLDGQNPVSERFRGSAAKSHKIDLTPFIGEAGSLRTSKSVRDPAGGFSLTLADKAYQDSGGFETLYGVIEPMDIVEIRMRHDPPSLGSVLPPIIMRGFVTEVFRNESMGSDGRPQRSVMVNGQDYGKLWQLLQILYLPGYVIGEDIISGFKLFERFGVGFKTAMKAKEFVDEVINKIVNPYLKKLMPENTPNPSEIKLDTDKVKHGTTSVTGPQNQEGTIYDLLRTYSDIGIWNELFIEDREDGVYCVYRPNPAKDINGKGIHNQVYEGDDIPDPATIDLPDTDVIAMSVTRSDANVANFYWVRAPRFELVDNIYRTQFALQGADKKTVLLDDYPNSDAKLYGIRAMYVDTAQGGDPVETFNSGQTKEKQAKRNSDMAEWINGRRKMMVEQNKDNILLERGSMRVRGNEHIRAGTFVRLQRGGFSAEYYVVQVEHDYAPFQGFFSTLVIERGMGFVERVKRGGGPASPYLSELQDTR